MSAHLLLLDCGPQASVQDGGRPGFQRQGLSPSGPMDALAMAAANALAGNPAGTAVLELALAGARLRAVGGPVRLALAGAPFGMSVEGEPMADHRSFTLAEGAELVLTPPRAGVFACLAVAGGPDLPDILGSRAFHRRAGLGGLENRSLRAGDRIPVASAGSRRERALAPLPLDADEPVRVVLGPQQERFTQGGIATLLGAAFTVSGQADRMGIALEGPAVEHGPEGFNIVSDATVFGSVQVPGSGRPIVLMADRQTTGGYPKIATVISADLRRLAQRRPGDAVRFRAVSVAEAVRLARARAAFTDALGANLLPVSTREERLMEANVAGAAVDAFEA